ncbi:hypothetical protein A3H22_00165 [Candidatus Peribacteria bacterium RIFCSPLOWO2_12_FULL_55_15]|nr:MAG: hypothetical protein A2789_01290 [Candidatus Peribacteria bacterium RIFCSPHIGHO2_01_FULL_54_22]OGJ63109.1 MAG: hypothetical protein A3D12_02715 [Candidatus Peribacteria bacterium RIFCSPHIGHO2_02_FULL_55_24]OGJ64038.1 MAG: hypothetical protein A3E47_02935 [Candidatus Peribacteria bacterium RIFCSPHIGHO2_12_FULL_54_10]OGJ68973.1 MAG: hypothetical protein A2947_03940 [Candidatus Peribacteria bacterium RIFCSPLOWO2_01_FULL_54_110]OGJ70171.1 MAG: hypothetical protein A3H90_00505 [Candidatus Pe
MRTLDALAQATIEIGRTIPKKDLHALADAVLRLLDQKGLPQKRAIFLRLLRRSLVKDITTLSLTLVTPSGNAGRHAESIASFVHLALGKPVELQESADKGLLGGALLAYNDERFDASIRGSLAVLHRHLSSPLPYDTE